MSRWIASLMLGLLCAATMRSASVAPAVAFQFPLPGSSLYVSALAVDPQGNSYLAGSLYGGSFPVSDGAAQTTPASIVIIKIAATGDRLVWATYLGGHKNRNWYWRGPMDRPTAIAVDPEGNVTVAGSTAANDFPIVNGFITAPQPTGTDAFLTKISADGSRFVYSTYLGPAGLTSIAIDAIGNAYVGMSGTAPLAYESVDLSDPPGSGTLVAAKFNPTGRPLFATRFGSSVPGAMDSITALALEGTGAVVVTGSATDKFPLVNPVSSACAVAPSSGICYAPFVAKLNPSGTAFVYATLLGGSAGSTSTTSVAVGPDGSAWIGGQTTGTDYPILNAIVPTPFPKGSFVLTQLGPAGRLMTSTYLAPTAAGTYSLPKVFVDLAGSPTVVAANASIGESPLGLAYPDAPLLVSDDAGASWSPSANGLTGSIAAVVSTASGPETWYAAASDGVYVSRDGMQSWQRSSVGLAGDQVATVAVDDAHEGTAYAGTFSGTYKTTDSGLTWRLVDKQQVFVGLAMPGLAVDGNGWVFVGTEGIRRSRDGGASWEDLSNGFRIYTTGTAPHYGQIAPIVFDPNRSGAIYAVQSGTLYRTRDGGQSWSPVSSAPLWTQALALPAGRPRRIYASVGNEVERSDDDAATWQALGVRGAVRQLLIDSGRPDTIYAIQPYGEPTLLVSTDAGQHWTNMAGDAAKLPSGATLAVDPRRPNRLVAAASLRTLPFVVGLSATGTQVRYAGFVDAHAVGLSGPVIAAADPVGAVYLVEAQSSQTILVKVTPPQILNPSRKGSS